MSIPLWAQSLTLILLASLFSGRPSLGNDITTHEKEIIEFPIDFNLPLNLRDFSTKHQIYYRVFSFGNTRLRIWVTSDTEEIKSQIKVQPADRLNDADLIDYEPKSSSVEGQTVYEILLKKPGSYFLIPPENHEKWEVSCLASCGRKEVSIGQLVSKLNSSELKYFSEKMSRYLKIKLPENTLSLKLIKKLVSLFLEKEEDALSRFPSLPAIFKVDEHRNLISLGLKRRGTSTEDNIPQSWREVVKYFEVSERPQPEPISPEIPNIGYGHFVSESVPIKMVAQNYALSSVMTQLAEQKGYELKFPLGSGKFATVKSLEDFIRVLWKTGHHVQIRDERSFANFLSFTYGEKYIRWPVWFKTQVLDNQNEELILPSPHSQFVWQITGPELNARVNFFLGISGVAFFPKLDEERPQWTGFKTKLQIFDSSKANRETILKATETAGKYMRRVRLESKLLGKDSPADGYGFTGICNDSSAVIERAISGKTSFFPLFRSPKLNGSSRTEDGLDEIFMALPKDIIPLEDQKLSSEEARQLYLRMIDMISLPYDPNMVWDKKFFEQFERLKEMAR